MNTAAPVHRTIHPTESTIGDLEIYRNATIEARDAGMTMPVALGETALGVEAPEAHLEKTKINNIVTNIVDNAGIDQRAQAIRITDDTDTAAAAIAMAAMVIVSTPLEITEAHDGALGPHENHPAHRNKSNDMALFLLKEMHSQMN